MSSADDDSLIRSLAAGREDAFAALYDRFGRALFQVAFALLGSWPDVEDAVQEMFVGLVRTRDKLAGVHNLRAYLFASLRHAALKLAAARQRERPSACSDLERLPAPVPRAVDVDRSLRLEEALRHLPEEQRELIALKVDAGLTFVEIAGLLGISPNTAASRYRYALEKLRAALQE
jgi:RNA polymerase sigma-70 factor (ECF subfamily)